MPQPIRIGTRDSALALWQAHYVQSELKKHGVATELVPIKSDGEKDLVTPLYEMGVQGIFTKTLDIALLQGRIDIAVHSLKDVPTQLPKGITMAAVPPRGSYQDVLVYKDKLPEAGAPYTVATSSLRRSAQWIYRFGNHDTDVLRGNINSRVRKLMENEHWDGALFAAAGIERIDLEVPNSQPLDWMIPAPAQGALGIVARTEDQEILAQCALLNDEATYTATAIERGFLRALMGGCSMPIGGLALVKEGNISFVGCVLTIDGKDMAKVEIEGPLALAHGMANEAARQIMDQGGRAIIQTFKK